MKNFFAVLVAILTMLSLTTVSFAANLAFSNCSIYKYLEEYEPGKFRLSFSYDDVQNERYLSYLQEYYPLYRAALDDPSKTIFIMASSSTTVSARITIYVLDNPQFSLYTLSNGVKDPWVKGDGFSLTIGVDSHGKISVVSYRDYTSKDTYNSQTKLQTNSTNAYYALQGRFGSSSYCNMLTGLSGFELVETSDSPVPSSHTLTVNYQYSDGTQAAEPVTQPLETGAEYKIPSPAIEGYTPNILEVSGIMPDEDLSVEVTYSRTLYLLNIQYLFEDGSQALPEYNHFYFHGSAYSVKSPDLEGYQPEPALVEGRMDKGNVSFSVVYREDSGGAPHPGGPGEPGGNEEEPFYGYDAFHNPFDSENKIAAGYNPFLPLWESIFQFSNPFEKPNLEGSSSKDPFVIPDPPAWDRYDPFKNPFGENDKNPYTDLWKQIEGFSGPNI